MLIKKLLKSIVNDCVLFVLTYNKQIRVIGNITLNKKCYFEGNNSLGENSILYNTYIGRGTYIGSNNMLNCVKIGRFCSIGSNIRNTTGRHPTSKFVSTHPAFFSKNKAAGFTFKNESVFDELKYVTDTNFLVSIGNDVWIGDNVIILDGVSIGDGAIIGAGSIVTKDIDPYSINAGNPSRQIRYRFSSREVVELLNLKWWDYSFDWIKNHHHLFEDIDIFFNVLNRSNNEGY